jgi:predicted lipid-binding transport protein (Tim44 family)
LAKGAKKASVPAKPAATAEAAAAGRALRRAPTPARCPQFVRREIAGALPEICRALLSKAVEGDMAALKMLWQMAMLDKAAEKAGNKTAAGFGARELGFARKALAEFRAR